MVSRLRAAMRGLRAGACIGLLSTLSTAAKAADPYEKDPAPTVQEDGFRGKLREWEVTIGGGAMVAPKFEGSDELEVSPIPFFSATFGGRIHLDPGGLQIDAYQIGGLIFSVKAGYDPGRDEGDSDHLRGLGDVDGGAQIGGLVAYKMGVFEFSAGLDKTIDGSDGLTGTFGAKVSQLYGRFLLAAGTSATWADDNHMEAFFGVNAGQSARSGLDEFDAEAGFKRVDIEASVTYLATENWLIRGQVGIGMLVGDAADSPIVQEEVQPSVLLGVGYKF